MRVSNGVYLNNTSSEKLKTLFSWLDLYASEKPRKDDGNLPDTSLTLNSTIHEVRTEPENPDSPILAIVPRTNAFFHFKRLQPNENRKQAETLAQFNYFSPTNKDRPEEISASINYDNFFQRFKLVYQGHEKLDAMDNKATNKRNIALEIFKHALDQLFYINSVDEIIKKHREYQESGRKN